LRPAEDLPTKGVEQQAGKAMQAARKCAANARLGQLLGERGGGETHWPRRKLRVVR
jgi:hypothetical protein